MKEIKLINGKFYQTVELTNEEILKRLNKQNKIKFLTWWDWREKDWKRYYTYLQAIEEAKKQWVELYDKDELEELIKNNLDCFDFDNLWGYYLVNGAFNANGSGHYWASTTWDYWARFLDLYSSEGLNLYIDNVNYGFQVIIK